MHSTKIVFLLFFLLKFDVGLQAQHIKFKNNEVIVDGHKCLKYSKNEANIIELSTLDERNHIILKYVQTSKGRNNGMYSKVIFVEQNQSFTSASNIFSKKRLIRGLLRDEVLNNCILQTENIGKFVLKYDEKIEERLIW